MRRTAARRPVLGPLRYSAAMACRREFTGVHGALAIERPAPRLVVLTFTGRDVGEFGEAPFDELAADVATGPLELFIDARGGVAASLEVSSEWAKWLARHKPSFRQVSMLTGTRFLQLTADFVRRFAAMGERMRVYTDPAAFEGALASSVANARADQAGDEVP